MQLKLGVTCFVVSCIAQIAVWALYMSDRVTLRQFWSISPVICIAIVSFVYTTWLVQADEQEERRGFEVKVNRNEKE